MKKSRHLKIEDKLIVKRIANDIEQDKADSSDYRENRKTRAELLRALELPKASADDDRDFRCQLPLTKTARNSLRARIMALLKKKRTFKPTEENDVKKVAKNEDLYEWIKSTAIKNYFDVLDSQILTVMNEGTVFSRITWDREINKVVEYREYPIPAPQLNMFGMPIAEGEQQVNEDDIIRDFFPEDAGYENIEVQDIGEDTYRVRYFQKVSNNPEDKQWQEDEADIDLSLDEHSGTITARCEKKAITFEGAVVDPLDYDALYHPADAKDLQKCDHINIHFKTSFSEILRKRDQGFYSFSDEVARAIQKSSGDVVPVDDDSLEAETKTIEGTSQAVQPDAASQGSPEYPGMVEGYESYYLWDVDGKGYQEQVVFTTICLGGTPKWVIRKKHLTEVFRTGLRPIVSGIWERRDHRLLGIGFIEDMEPVQRLINDVLNIILNASAQALNPPGTYDPQGANNEIIKYRPGELIPIRGNPPQYIPFPSNFPVGFEVLNFLIDIFQREASTSDQIQGQSGGVKTATATVKLIQEAYANMGLCFERVVDFVRKQDQMIYDLYMAYAPDSLKYRVTGPDNDYAFQEFTRDDFMIRPDICLEVNIAETSKEYVQQVAQEVFALVTNQVLAQTGVVTPEKIYNAAKDLLEAMDRKNYRDYIQKPQSFEPQDPEQENYLMVEGESPIPMPQDDDQQHIRIHQEFIPLMQQVVVPDQYHRVLQMVMAHIALHQNQMAEKMRAQQAAMAQMAMAAQAQQAQGWGNGKGRSEDELQGKVTGRINPGATSPFGESQQAMAMPGMGEV